MNIPRFLSISIFVSLALHLVGFFFVFMTKGLEPFLYGDAVGYVSLATNMAHGLGFLRESGSGLVLEVFRTPGLPLLLMPFVSSGTLLSLYLLLQTIVASLLLPYLTWWIGMRLFNARVALIASMLMAFEPMLIFFSWFVLTEIPFLICSLLGFATLIRALEFRINDRSFSTFAIAASFFSGFAVLIRPGNLPLFVFAGALLLFVNMRSVLRFKQLAIIACLFVLVLTPWFYRNYQVTGVFSLSGAGWRNVYTDYLPSIRQIKNGTDFSYERKKIRTQDAAKLGLTSEDLNNPKYAPLLREVSLKEIRENLSIVAKLETILLLNFFLNDGYYYQASRLGFMERLPKHISPTREFLDRGFSALPVIWDQLVGQRFVPLVGHVVTGVIFFFALLGTILSALFRRYYIGMLLALLIALSAVMTSVLGFGVEARLRISIMPLLFLLSAVGIEFCYSKIRYYYDRRFIKLR